MSLTTLMKKASDNKTKNRYPKIYEDDADGGSRDWCQMAINT